MARLARFLASVVLIALLTLSFNSFPAPSAALAADGEPLCNVVGTQDAPSIATATDLWTWIAWRDFRRSNPSTLSDIYFVRLPAIVSGPQPAGAASLASAAPSRTLADGTLACDSGTAGPPVVVPSDSGTVLILFGDTRNPWGVYAVRMRPDGS